MRANRGRRCETERLGELHESVLAIRRELRSRKAQVPQAKASVRALEVRLRTKLLPAVGALCRGGQNQAACAHAICGSIHLELRQYRKAQTAYTLADQMMPGNRAILNGLSECAAENGDLLAAKRAAKQITERFPAQAGGWANLAMLLGMAGEPDEAIAAVDHAIELSPADVTFRMIRDNCIMLRDISSLNKENPQDN